MCRVWNRCNTRHSNLHTQLWTTITKTPTAISAMWPYTAMLCPCLIVHSCWTTWRWQCHQSSTWLPAIASGEPVLDLVQLRLWPLLFSAAGDRLFDSRRPALSERLRERRGERLRECEWRPRLVERRRRWSRLRDRLRRRSRLRDLLRFDLGGNQHKTDLGNSHLVYTCCFTVAEYLVSHFYHVYQNVNFITLNLFTKKVLNRFGNGKWSVYESVIWLNNLSCQASHLMSPLSIHRNYSLNDVSQLLKHKSDLSQGLDWNLNEFIVWGYCISPHLRRLGERDLPRPPPPPPPPPRYPPVCQSSGQSRAQWPTRWHL